eukprot:TRINITY_DN31356_c0_g1_i1.p1 TRINITY_DN31356_c0_g1~~TRINITY_DN31356_c0_g1_i1.p1  ORF type:complete len:704 (+),score=137.61 TRINITY_DN31356_c0_g1_i1:90-2114(+)
MPAGPMHSSDEAPGWRSQPLSRRWWPGDQVVPESIATRAQANYVIYGEQRRLVGGNRCGNAGPSWVQVPGASPTPNGGCEGDEAPCVVTISSACGHPKSKEEPPSHDVKCALQELRDVVDSKFDTLTRHLDERLDHQIEQFECIAEKSGGLYRFAKGTSCRATPTTEMHDDSAGTAVTTGSVVTGSTLPKTLEYISKADSSSNAYLGQDCACVSETECSKSKGPTEADMPMMHKRGAIFGEIGDSPTHEAFVNAVNAVNSPSDATKYRPKGRSEGRLVDKTDELWVDGEDGLYVYLREFKCFVKSSRFDHIMGAVIVVNTLFLGVQIDIKARAMEANGDSNDPAWISLFETLFTIVFLFELIARCIAFHPWFCCSAWNVFDTIVVLSAILEEIQKYAEEGNSFLGTLRAFKMIRVLKLLRALRIIRVVRAFRELRIVLMSIVNALRQLFWTLSLLFVLIYMVGILVLVELTGTEQPYHDTHFAHIRRRYFADLLRTLMTVFQCTTYGALWEEASASLEEVIPLIGLMWLVYMGFVVFAFQNTVTGMCVDLAMTMQREDARDVMLEEYEAREKVQVNLRQLLMDCDPECKGFFTRKALKQLMKEEDFQALLKDCDIESRDVLSFYDQVAGMTGVINMSDVDTFVQGCFRLKGVATNIDIMTLSYRQKKILSRLEG